MGKNIRYIKKNGEKGYLNLKKLSKLISNSAESIYFPIDEETCTELAKRIYDKCDRDRCLEREEYVDILESVLAPEYPEVLEAYLKSDIRKRDEVQRSVTKEMSRIMISGDRSNGTVDSALSSTKRALKLDAMERVMYKEYFLSDAAKQALLDGFIYVHDMGARRDTINCCLFDMERVLRGGFEMGNIWYPEPATLSEAFDVLASVTLSCASQIYGGFTISRIDDLLSYYAQKSFKMYFEKYRGIGLDSDKAESLALKDIEADYDSGFRSLEYKFNTIISSRGDYPFITISFGLCKDSFSEMAVRSVIKTRQNGQGLKGFKRPVLFPKLVFLYDENLHSGGKKLEYLFEIALDCSSKVMYPEFLSLTGEGYVAEMYKTYGEVISPMCCRAFLTPWYEKGGLEPMDPEDRPVYMGRFNYGVVSLNLPMILQQSREEKKDFYELLDGYLQMILEIHRNTYKYLSKMKASSNPVAYTQGGFLGGTLSPEDTIEPLLASATASFGVTALNELQRLYNQRSLYEDGEFALEVMKYMNDRVEEFSRQDGRSYNVYGTPAEKLCGLQAKQFREKYGIIRNVSDRAYFSNSFHCHVSEDIDQIQKQESESRFWNYFNGGKIQYVRINGDELKNPEGIRGIVENAMRLGLYEGINLSLAYCNRCGWDSHYVQHMESCPKCGSEDLIKIERMCGFLSYTRMNGKSRLNDAKMAEIKDRRSM